MTTILRRVESTRDQARARLTHRVDELAVWGAIGLFVVAQATRLAVQASGPSMDEGIYLTAGLRTLQGHGVADGYLTWFAGSLLWPVVGSIGHMAGGLPGARLVALALVTLGLLGALQATANLYGRRARRWAALLLLGWGAALGVGRLAEYDAVAIAGIGLCVWALTHFARRDHRLWLVASAVALFVGIIGKYAAAFCLPCVVWLLLALRGHRRWADLTMFLFVLGGLLLAYFLPFRWQLAAFPAWRIENNPDFGATLATNVTTLAYHSAVPTALALVGLVAAWRWDRRVATPLFASTLLFPAYHVLAGNTVGAHKHVVLGMLLAVPLIGFALDRLVRRRVGTAVAVMVLAAFAAVGWWQSILIERYWPDVRPTVAYLRAHVEPGDLIANNGSWAYTLGLYSHGSLERPSDHRDVYSVANEPLPRPLCEFDWFVDQNNHNDWPDSVTDRIRSCGTFELVHSTQEPITQLGADLRPVTYGVRTDVWSNISRDKP